MKNPWKTLSSKEIYKNQWLRLREDQVITPSGHNGIYGVVEAKPAIAIVPLSENQDTYLVGQYRYTLDEYSWEVPEGGALDGEHTLSGAKRELKEETGLTARTWTYLGELYTSNSFTNERGYVYLAEDIFDGVSNPDSTEQLRIKKIPFLQAWQLVLEGSIKDALSIVSILRAYEYLKKSQKLNN
ncbi:MAG: NUDIX domain-containing protein [Caldithrix sp.]|nr:NUDIX domain-containing protein [Caldithrix sp.]